MTRERRYVTFMLHTDGVVESKSIRMPLGLFRGVRTFTLTPSGDGSTTFEMVEVFSGLLEPLISKSIPDMTDSFEEFAESLKRAAEVS